MPRGKKRTNEVLTETETSSTPTTTTTNPSSSNSSNSSSSVVVDINPPIELRRSARRKKQEEDIINPPPPKEKKIKTIGQHLFDEREKKTEEINETLDLSHYEIFQNYNKEDIINNLNLTEKEGLNHELYQINDISVVFLTLETGSHPKQFTHICNNSSIQWNIEHYDIPFSGSKFRLGNVVFMFVRGQYVEGTTTTSNNYKCLGLIGVQSTSGHMRGGVIGAPHIYLRVTFVFDYFVTRKELETQFGENVMKCKKNKYGCSICA